MTHQKKKKMTPQMLKQQEAEIKKKYKQKIKWLFSQFGHEHLFSLVPDSYLNILFSIRYKTPHIYCKGRLPQGFKTENELNIDFISFLKANSFVIPETPNNLNYYDYFTCGYDFCSAFLKSISFQFKDAELIKDSLKGIYLEFYTTESINLVVNRVFSELYQYYSSFNYGYYIGTISKEKKEPSNFVPNSHCYIAFSITEIHRPRPIEIKIGNNVRPVFDVAWIDHGIYTPVCLKAEDLYLDRNKYPDPIPVYIQSHAIQRLAERIALIKAGETHFAVVISILDFLKVRQIEERSYLIDYYFYGWKIGYLWADFIKGKLIIRTFLLLTQEGTPEAVKFKKITRLRKEDIDYLKMTSLGDFADSGIENDPRLMSIFDEAGLTPLLDCAKHFYYLDEGVKTLSERVNNYITLEPLNTNWHELAETIDEEMETENQPHKEMSLVEINN